MADEEGTCRSGQGKGAFYEPCSPGAYSVVQEVIELLRSFRDVMRRNFERLDVNKIQTRW